MRFRDREEAGRLLAGALDAWRGRGVVVLGLPRGGVPVAAEVAAGLAAPLDVLVVRKLGAPGAPELALGAVGEGGLRVLNDEVLRRCAITPDVLAPLESEARVEVRERAARLRGGEPRLRLAGKVAVVVDDGMATGATARVACRLAREAGATEVVLAVPVAPPDAVRLLGRDCRVVCLDAPADFRAVSQAYEDFHQVSDDDVVPLLRAARARSAGVPGRAAGAGVEQDVTVTLDGLALAGRLAVPERARGIVVFAHGSGSSRSSPRNRQVAAQLNQAGLGTLLVDLLTPGEQEHRELALDVELLGERLLGISAWVRGRPGCARLPLGYFGASTGAAAALWAAADPRSQARVVVSRGGRPDLAARRLDQVSAPTLLIVGDQDEMVLRLNRQAMRFLAGIAELSVVRGAGHLFEEPGALDRVTALARDWFLRHLGSPVSGAGRRPAS